MLMFLGSQFMGEVIAPILFFIILILFLSLNRKRCGMFALEYQKDGNRASFFLRAQEPEVAS